MTEIEIDVLIIGGGTAGSNSARAALAAGAERVVMVHTPELINTCIEAGCMPSKSILAGAHAHEPLTDIVTTRNAHIERLTKALTDGFATSDFTVVTGTARLTSPTTAVIQNADTKTTYKTKGIVIATGSHPFIPPIPGLETIGEKLLVSDDVVSRRASIRTVPKTLLTIGSGPIGLELSTFFHDLGSKVRVLQRRQALGLFDPEFGDERVRAANDPNSFPIILNCELQSVHDQGETVLATINHDGEIFTETFDAILVATGRRPNTATLGLDEIGVSLNERGTIEHDDTMATSVPGIYVAGDVTGHHQILHFAAKMGNVAGHNAAGGPLTTMDYDRHMLAVSFDQFPSALIGLTEMEAQKRGLEIITATRHFNSIGLGILKRQEYGLWKLIAERDTGKILGAQILGPDSTGELIQLLVPIIYNGNTFHDILEMTWYHPTYAEILLSLARDLRDATQT